MTFAERAKGLANRLGLSKIELSAVETNNLELRTVLLRKCDEAIA